MEFALCGKAAVLSTRQSFFSASISTSLQGSFGLSLSTSLPPPTCNVPSSISIPLPALPHLSKKPGGRAAQRPAAERWMGGFDRAFKPPGAAQHASGVCNHNMAGLAVPARLRGSCDAVQPLVHRSYDGDIRAIAASHVRGAARAC